MISIAKAGIFSTMPKKFELRFTTAFKYVDYDPTPYFLKLYGLAGGKIEFDYLGSKRRFGQTVDRSQATEIISHINIALNRVSY